ncbi:MAG: argininosuccinate lyase [Bdellovibrionales bacterium]|nr:argininosuccinate lyase [Bdellovibrionales bacterium]
MAKRLWDKGGSLDQAVQQFTVGNDPQLDLALVRWDCFGSAAHARMLTEAGILPKAELPGILEGLSSVREQALGGSFVIPPELEDCHTAIESALVEKLGESGKRIHAGRSRNDQVITAMRLYQRSSLIDLLLQVSQWCDAMAKRADELGDVDMPGYTHLQRAMPSSVGMWMHAFIESALSSMRFGLSVLESLDANPLGAAAGFGASLPLDRTLTAKLMGFSQVQRSPIDVQNSRGRFELRVVHWCEEVSALIEKLAWDMHLYFSEEFGFLDLPTELTTGSSIMPQKRNPDVLELLRARASRVRGAATELAWVVGKLPSNYHRDYQYSKEPVMRALQDTAESLDIVRHVVSLFTVNESALKAAMTQELYATYYAYRLVNEGKPFRDAYKETADKVTKGEIDVDSLKADADAIKARAVTGIESAMKEIAGLSSAVFEHQRRFADCERSVFEVKGK